MLYSEYVKSTMQNLVDTYGGVRKASEHTGVDSAIISKIITGKYLPKVKTFAKWFPETLRYDFDDSCVIHEKTIKIEVYCDELEELKSNLALLGYEIVIQKKES